jgi:NAD(P) transhydrogenase
VLYSAGREGATSEVGLDLIGLEADERGGLAVDEHYRTSVENVYAVGDVIGFPSLAATSMEQGRLAACHAFGVPKKTMGDLLPIGIYTIPEISFVGKTEEDLTGAAVPYEVGVSRHRELARSQILGDGSGLLKLLVHAEDHTLLGVHVFGTGATELVHIGQTLMGSGGTVEYLVEAVFNYPTLAESYKVAALDAMNKMNAILRVSAPRTRRKRAA